MARNQGLQEMGPTSQNPDAQPPKDAVEQQEKKKGIKPGLPNPIATDSRVHG